MARLTSLEAVDRGRDLNAARQQIGERGKEGQENKAQAESSSEHSCLSPTGRHDAIRP